MKKAVIETGGKQYVVTKGDVIDVELVTDEKLKFEPLLVFDGADITMGDPIVKGAKVEAKVIETVRADKVTAIRYKAKKRVHKTRGHRQNYSRIEITNVA